MDITIKIEAPGLADAINALACAMAGNIELLLEGAGSRSAAAAPTTQVKETPKETHSETSEPPRTNTDNTVSLEQVRAKLAKLSQDGKQTEVKALLGKFGVKKLTEVPEEKYPELMKEAEAI